MIEAVAETEFRRVLAVAHELADLSAPVILKHFRNQHAVDNKASGGAFDPVTDADRGAEQVIVETLKQRFPDHGILGEEFGQHIGLSPIDWVIDPIDGTRAFIMGSPLWGTLIGVRDQGKPYLGLMNQPFTGERFWSEEDSSFMRIGTAPARALKTRSCARLEDAILTSTHPDLFEGTAQQHALTDLKRNVRMTRYGGDGYGYCLLAAGFVDLIVETGLKPYDIVALIPIIEKAGGLVTTWEGKPATEGGDIVAAGDPRVHEATLKLIALKV